MEPEPMEVSVNLTNEKVQFSGNARSNPFITIDYRPPLGDGQGYTPLELLLISLASCSGTTIIALLRKSKKKIFGFIVKAKGVRRAKHPTSFDKIYLSFVLYSQDTGSADMEQAIKFTEESFCPVWAMLKNNVEIVTDYKIIA